MKIAIIGNANTLKGHNLGNLIDNCDHVIRINFGYLPEFLNNDRGFKTSVVYHCSTANKRINPPDGVSKKVVNHFLRLQFEKLFGSLPTSGVMACIDYLKDLKKNDCLFIGGISFFKEPYISKYSNDEEKLDLTRNKFLNENNNVHSHHTDLSAFKFSIINHPSVCLDPYLSNMFPNHTNYVQL
jgi:hypothetical protein